MKRTIIGLMCLIALLCVALTASAEPVVTHGGYTAYLGASNYLYLQTPVRTSHMPVPIADIVSMSDTDLYCIDSAGRLIRISLESNESQYVSIQPTQEQIDQVKTAPLFQLENSILSLVNDAPTDTALSTSAQYACTNGDTLFWIESDAIGRTTLKSLLLNDATATVQTMGEGVAAPLSMIATEDMLTMVAGDHTVTVVKLIDRSRATYPATSMLTTHAVAIGDQLIRYDLNSQTGHFATEENIQSLSALSTTAPLYATNTPTVTSTVAPTTTATSRPTNTPKASSSSSSSSSSNASLSKGDKGSSVRKMQKRLAELGYPVGVVDGVWGDDTQLAVNLFQFAIGYTERNYATSSMLNRLYSKKAPSYDPYLALKQGKKGTPVLIMQTTLKLMGYDPGKLDGIYGKGTTAAVSLFQQVAGLKVTGTADSATLKVLYSPDCPLNPSVYPTQKPTDAPTMPPTSQPTDAPTNAPKKITKVTIIYDKTKQPVISQPNPGDVLTVEVQPSGAKFTCEWHYEDSTEVLPNGTNLTYTVTKDDLGKKLVCTVTGIDGYTGTVVSTDAVIATTTDLK